MIDDFLSQLQKVHGRNGRWTACCPAHGDKSPSLAVGILNYMRSRPYAEVAQGVQALEAVLTEQLPKADPE